MNRSLALLLSGIAILIALIFLFVVPSKNNSDDKVPPGTDGAGIPPAKEQIQKEPEVIQSGQKTRVTVFPVENGFGYDISLEGKPYIHQPYIPAVQGNQVFASEEDAKKTAALVSHKIENKINPPSISPKELDSLKIKYKKG